MEIDFSFGDEPSELTVFKIFFKFAGKCILSSRDSISANISMSKLSGCPGAITSFLLFSEFFFFTGGLMISSLFLFIFSVLSVGSFVSLMCSKTLVGVLAWEEATELVWDVVGEVEMATVVLVGGGIVDKDGVLVVTTVDPLVVLVGLLSTCSVFKLFRCSLFRFKYSCNETFFLADA